MTQVARRSRRAEHQGECRFRIAMLCPASIECAHGYDVCPDCDPCGCATDNVSNESSMSSNSPTVGSRWRDRDPRCNKRVVEVVSFAANKIRIKTVVDDKGNPVAKLRMTAVDMTNFRKRFEEVRA